MSAIQFIGILSIIAGLLCFIRGLYRPYILMCYAVAMIPMQIQIDLIGGIRGNEFAIVLWLIRYVLLIFQNRSLTIKKYEKPPF